MVITEVNNQHYYKVTVHMGISHISYIICYSVSANDFAFRLLLDLQQNNVE